jgi:hypothetical protein
LKDEREENRKMVCNLSLHAQITPHWIALRWIDRQMSLILNEKTSKSALPQWVTNSNLLKKKPAVLKLYVFEIVHLLLFDNVDMLICYSLFPRKHNGLRKKWIEWTVNCDRQLQSSKMWR